MELHRRISKTHYKYGSPEMDIESRYNVLNDTAGDMPIDPYESVSNYLTIGSVMYNTAHQLLKDKAYEDAYILFQRYKSIFEKKFRNHPGYTAIADTSQDTLNHQCMDAEVQLEFLKTELDMQFENHKSNSDPKLMKPTTQVPAQFQWPNVLTDLFQRYADSNKLNANGFLRFLQTEQNDEEFTLMTFEDFFPKSGMLNSSATTNLKGFVDVLFSSKFDIFKNAHRIVHQDMTRPLCDYYIASSHNTYLSGNQLASKSTIKSYETALRSGCRCVEMDLWDGEKYDDEPVVYHGRTLTSKLALKHVLEFGIKPHAFATSEYPVILSLENHCGVNGQIKVAAQLIKTLGEMLYRVPVDSSMDKLPSPESLKRKIIIKASMKKTQPNEDNIDSSTDEEDDPAVLTAKPNDENQSVSNAPTEDLSLVDADLSKLTNICQAVKFKSFEKSAQGPCYHMSSFSESKAKKLGKQFPKQFVSYNQRNLSRIYPSGTKIDSSNFDPTKFWKFGCQIVALNYQDVSKNMLMNKFMFSDNGQCGYILKPTFLTDPVSNFDPNNKQIELVPNVPQVLHLHINVLCGLLLPLIGSENTNIYVHIRVKGFNHDNDSFTTKTSNNQFCPEWNDSHEFKIYSPDYAFLLFAVYDKAWGVLKSDTELGFFGIPVTAIGSGYRNVNLVDKKGQLLAPAALLVKIEQKYQVPATAISKER